MSEPRFELEISDPIANHITTRPRSIYCNYGIIFEMSSISNMIYLYGLIQPMGGRNRVKYPGLMVKDYNIQFYQKLAEILTLVTEHSFPSRFTLAFKRRMTIPIYASG